MKDHPTRQPDKKTGNSGTPHSGWIDIALQTSLTLALAVLAGVFGGRWLDNTFGTLPVFTIIGTLWGAGGGTFWIVLKIKRFSEAVERDQNSNNE